MTRICRKLCIRILGSGRNNWHLSGGKWRKIRMEIMVWPTTGTDGVVASGGGISKVRSKQ
ncbi:hypothetical protein KY289_016866 [Solanum tuberosum]|nr:hypothetical protein KY284_016665 [Solanum tuberosum]KAH0689508.1 hypothetical protein KY289_016866 [Solanum tuberosum]